MTDKLKRTILGAVIAIALAAAVSYGLISQQTADNLQSKANQAITEDQGASPPTPPQQAPTSSAPQEPRTQEPRTPAPQPSNPTSPNPAPVVPRP